MKQSFCLPLLFIAALTYVNGAFMETGNHILTKQDILSRQSRQAANERHPTLPRPPVLKGPTIRPNNMVEFTCEIEYNGNDNNQRFEVKWTFNRVEDPQMQTVTLKGNERVATLMNNQVRNHIDQEVECVIVTYFLGRETEMSAPTKSNTIYFGIDTDPVLHGPIIRNGQTFHYECQVFTSALAADQRIEIAWTFDGKEDPNIKSAVIAGDERRAILNGADLKSHINKQIGCQARQSYTNDLRSKYRPSKTKFFGIKLDPSGSIDIRGIDREREVTVTSTIPIVCEQGQDCCVTFGAMLDKTGVVTIKGSCNVRLCSNNWDDKEKSASFKITLVPVRTSITAGTRQTSLHIETSVFTGTGTYIDIYKGYRSSTVKITVHLEKGYKCEMTGDPHFKGFDFPHAYHLYQTGDYIVYEVKDRNFVVQIRNWQCWSVTCICGVVVRENNDIIRVFGCDKRSNLLAASAITHHQLSEGTKVQRSNNGHHIYISLPSGSEVKIDIFTYGAEGAMNVYVMTPSFDRNKARGICGTNDGNPANDFTHADGITITPACPNANCQPHAFFQSWRVYGKDSLFESLPQLIKVDSKSQHCSCVGNAGQVKDDFCSTFPRVQPNTMMCPGCPDITRMMPQRAWDPEFRPNILKKRSIRNELYEADFSDMSQKFDEELTNSEAEQQWLDNQINDNKRFNEEQHSFMNSKRQKRAIMAKSEAETMCSNSMKTAQLMSDCQNVDNMLQNSLANCVEDIMSGGTTSAMDTVKSAFTTICQIAMAEDEKNYDVEANGALKLKAVYDDMICPVDCELHGACKNGKCVCNENWEGETCHMEKGKGPQINRTDGSMCHANKSCVSVEFDVSNVNIMDDLQCKVLLLDEQGVQIDQAVVTKAKRSGSLAATCDLPQKGKSTQNFTVSLTKGSNLFGNEFEVKTYDATCLECNESGCVEKTTSCHINQACFADGERNPQNNREICTPKLSTSLWSDAPNGAGVPIITPWSMILLSLITLTIMAGQNVAHK